MKKNLLFLILSCLVSMVNAQTSETIYKVMLSDLPEGLQNSEMYVSLSLDDGREYSMTFDEETKTFVLNSNELWGFPGGVSRANVKVLGQHVLPLMISDWSFISGHQEQAITISLKSYRKVFLEMEQGCDFGYKKDDNGNLALQGLHIYKNDMYKVSAGIDESVNKYYIYATPGDYYYSGDLLRLSDNLNVTVFEEPFSISAESNAILNIDLSKNSLVSFRLYGIDTSLNEIPVRIEGTDVFKTLYCKDGSVSFFAKIGSIYMWNVDIDNYSPLSGRFVPEEQAMEVVADFSDHVPCSFSLIGLENYSSVNGRLHLEGTSGSLYLDVDQQRGGEVLLAPGVYWAFMDVSDVYVETDGEEPTMYGVFPLAQLIKVGDERMFTFDYSDYQKVSFFYNQKNVASEVLRLDPVVEYDGGNGCYGSRLLLPPGNYEATTEQEGNILNLRLDVKDEDLTVNYDYDSENYANLTIKVDNFGDFPFEVGEKPFDEDYVYISLYKDGEYVAEFDFDSNNLEPKMIGLEKGVYTYRAYYKDYVYDYIFYPFIGSLDLREGDVSLVLDMHDLCSVSFDLKDSQGQPIDKYFCMIGDDIDYLYDLYGDEKKHFVFPAGQYDVTIFAPNYQTMSKIVEINSKTEELNYTMTSASCYPLFVDPINVCTKATITLENVGSYSILDGGEAFWGSFKPFTGIKEGKYRLTVTAPGYETYNEIIDVNAQALSPMDDYMLIYYPVYMNMATTSIVPEEANGDLPSIRLLQNRIQVTCSSDCRVEVFDLSGRMMVRDSGCAVTTKSLASGVYVVRAISAYGTVVKKVLVGETNL